MTDYKCCAYVCAWTSIAASVMDARTYDFVSVCLLDCMLCVSVSVLLRVIQLELEWLAVAPLYLTIQCNATVSDEVFLIHGPNRSAERTICSQYFQID